MSKVSVTNMGCIHYHAMCQDCGWSAGMQTTEAKTPADVRRLAGTHVSKTGHSVFVESGKQVRYTAKEKKE